MESGHFILVLDIKTFCFGMDGGRERVSLYILLFVCIYILKYTPQHIYTHTHTHINIYIYVCTHVGIHTLTCTYMSRHCSQNRKSVLHSS